MNEQFLELYNRELEFLSDFVKEYAENHPEAATRLGIESGQTNDPYVNMLLDGFAHLTARVQHQLEAEFPRFTEQMFQMVYPHYVTPIPSMTVVRFDPLLTEGSLASGFPLPRRTQLRYTSQFSDVPCLFETAHDVTLWPITIDEVSSFLPPGPLSADEYRDLPDVQAGIYMKLRAVDGVNFNTLPIRNLTFYLKGAGDIPLHLYEQLLGNLVTVIAGPTRERLSPASVTGMGFDDEEALLPTGSRLFSGYRLLKEYFAFPERFLFVNVGEQNSRDSSTERQLADAVRNCVKNEFEIVFLFKRRNTAIENTIDASNFQLFCSPAVNFFHKQADNIRLDANKVEYKVLPDRRHPIDFEVYDVTKVQGQGGAAQLEKPFYPFYASFHSPDIEKDERKHHGDSFPPNPLDAAFFTMQRRPREKSEDQRRRGTDRQIGYLGSEAYLSLVNSSGGPLISSELRQLVVHTRCTNRYLTWKIARQAVPVSFELPSGAPVTQVPCIEPTTRPRPAAMHGEIAWRLLNHLALNFAPLAPPASGESALHGVPHALRELLYLYCDKNDPDLRRQVDAIQSVYSEVVSEELPDSSYDMGRGIRISLTFDDAVLTGGQLSAASVFLLGAVLERFFARYASINSFTQTVVKTASRGEIMRWPVRLGTGNPI